MERLPTIAPAFSPGAPGLAEVTMEHAGIVLGLEMSRLARSSKDWHHLFELCGIFGTLLADQEGVYEANDPNDRLIVGLKGIMSKVELQTMRNRLDRGRLNKAQRGEMFHGVPTGYVILPTGAVDFDPDEQAREVVHLIFDKFDELGGTCPHCRADFGHSGLVDCFRHYERPSETDGSLSGGTRRGACALRQ